MMDNLAHWLFHTATDHLNSTFIASCCWRALFLSVLLIFLAAKDNCGNEAHILRAGGVFIRRAESSHTKTDSVIEPER